ncbi:MFS transporter [Leifsonia sp. NPDC058194]|uniref:MFS transporter n=1 Tax=Leifsonia sp. NPDC058194 TaxID=3346374 RepID=UPI0036DC7245
MFASLRIPGAARAFIPALIGRSALAMAGLAVLLAVQSRTGSFALAGLASAAFGVANVIAAPWRARAVDRWGQARALGLLALVQAAGFLALGIVATVPAEGPGWFLALAAAVGLSAPPLGAAMRVVWSSLTEPGAQREKAFSLDAVAEELLFVGGPVAITAIIVASSPGVGLAVVGVVGLAGTVGLITSAASRAQGARGAIAREHRARPLAVPGFTRVLVVLVGVGAVLGVVEIAAPALAAEQDAVPVAGWLLAAFASGSAIGGLLYGHIRWSVPLGARLLVLCLGMGATAVAVSLLGSVVGSLAVFAVGLVALGAFLAPSLITGYLVADSVVPVDGRTEASAWINTAVNLGASVASAVAGAAIDEAGAGIALLVVGLVAAAGAVVVPRRRLRAAVES